MTASLAMMKTFKDGQGLSDKQELALGEIGLDKIGQRWSYCLFQENLVAGQWVADFRAAPNGGIAVHALPSSVDELYLEVEQDKLYALAGDMRAEFIVGAYGEIDNIGFVVTGWEKIPNTTPATARMSVRPLHNDDDVLRGNEWPALPTGSLTTIYLPGRIDNHDQGSPLDIRGVVQRDVTASDSDPKYGWVLQKGIGVCAISTTAGGAAAGERFLAPDAGTTATRLRRFGTNGTRALNSVARALGATTLGELVLAEIQIDNDATALFGVRTDLPIGARGQVIR